MKALYCPSCGAQISLDDSREFGFCQYCGTKIMLDDHRSTHRVVDEARIKEAETERLIRLKELELEEQELNRGRKGRAIAFTVAATAGVIGAILMAFDNFAGMGLIGIAIWIALFAFVSGNIQKEKREARRTGGGMIQLTAAAVDYEGKNFSTVKSVYSRQGFRNITVIDMQDLRVGLLKKPGTVDEVTIDGEEPQEDEWYRANAEVIITYHSFAR